MSNNIVGSVVRHNDCFGRDGLVAQIWDKLEKGNVLLAAPRRFGKTSLMYRLIDDPKPGYKLIHLDLEYMIEPSELISSLIFALKKDPSLAGFIDSLRTVPAKIWGGIKNNISEVELYKFKVALKESVGKTWKEIGDELFELIAKSDQTIIFVLDEFAIMIDQMAQQTEHRKDAKSLLRWLRMIRQRSEEGKVRFLIAGSIGIDHILTELGEIASINDFEKISVPPFSRKTAEQFLAELSKSYQVPLTESASKKVLDLIGTPVPYFLQIMFSQIAAAFQLAEQKITPALIESIYRDKILGVDCRSYFEHYYCRLRNYYRPHQEKAAKIILRGLAREGALTKDICFQLYKKAVSNKAGIDGYNRLMAELENDFYISYDAESNCFEFASKLLRDWWLRYYGLEI